MTNLHLDQLNSKVFIHQHTINMNSRYPLSGYCHYCHVILVECPLTLIEDCNDHAIEKCPNCGKTFVVEE